MAITIEELLATDALSVNSLTSHINNLPPTPTRIRDMGLFEEEGVTGTMALIGIDNSINMLVPAVPRGAPSQPKALIGTTAKAFSIPHLPQRSTLMADEVYGARLFGGGSESNVDAVTARVNAYQAIHKRDNDYTIEYHRLGAITGKVLNADGSVLMDLYREFEANQITVELGLSTANVNARNKILEAKRAAEAVLGGIVPRGYVLFAGSALMDAVTSNESVETAFALWNNGSALRDDMRSGFNVATDVKLVEYPSFGGPKLIADNEGYLVPVGVPGMFQTKFAPADYVETVGTIGLPYYTKTEAMPFGKGIMIESQSNPLNVCTRPAAVIKVKA